MQKVASAHFPGKNRHGKKIKPNLDHNDRTQTGAKHIHQEKSHLNECTMSAKQTSSEIDKLYKQAKQNYYNYCADKNGIAKSSGKPKGLQNFAEKSNSFTELIFEIDDNTTMNQCQELSQKIAELTGFTPLQIAIHRDEGYYNENKEFITHYHAHAVFFTLDKETGIQLNRKSASNTPENLAKIQDLASEVFGMPRGERRFEKGEKKEYIQDYNAYRVVKEAERETRENLKSLEKDLKVEQEIIDNKRSDLKEQEEKIKKAKAEYISMRKEAAQKFKDYLQQIDLEFRQKESFWRNLLTLGTYHKKLRAERKRQKDLLTDRYNEVEEKASQDYENRSKIDKKKIKELEDTLKQKNENLSHLEQELRQYKEKQEEASKKSKEIELYFKGNDEKALERFYPKAYKAYIEQKNKEATQTKSKEKGGLQR